MKIKEWPLVNTMHTQLTPVVAEGRPAMLSQPDDLFLRASNLQPYIAAWKSGRVGLRLPQSMPGPRTFSTQGKLPLMDKLLSMRVFSKVVDQKSFARAAAHLDMSPAVVSRHVMALEDELGTRLLVRTTRSLTLTENGEIFLERARQILADVNDAESLVKSATKSASGILRIATLANFGLYVMPNLVRQFRKIYPNITLDVTMIDGPIDFVANGCDLAITDVRNVQYSETVVRRLVPAKRVLCATPEYLSGKAPPRSPADLVKHDCITTAMQSGRHDIWQLHDDKGIVEQVPIKAAVICNTGAMAYQCVLNHIGIGNLSCFLAQELLETGRLVRVLAEYQLPERELVLAYPDRRQLTSRGRTFIEFVIKKMPEMSNV